MKGSGFPTGFLMVFVEVVQWFLVFPLVSSGFLMFFFGPPWCLGVFSGFLEVSNKL